MTPNEYNRLNKAHELRCDIELLTDAIAVLRKQPIRFHGSLAGSYYLDLVDGSYLDSDDYYDDYNDAVNAGICEICNYIKMDSRH